MITPSVGISHRKTGKQVHIRDNNSIQWKWWNIITVFFYLLWWNSGELDSWFMLRSMMGWWWHAGFRYLMRVLTKASRRIERWLSANCFTQTGGWWSLGAPLDAVLFLLIGRTRDAARVLLRNQWLRAIVSVLYSYLLIGWCEWIGSGTCGFKLVILIDQ